MIGAHATTSRRSPF